MPANPRYANGHRRRQVRRQVLAEETYCALCGGIVDQTLRLGTDGKPHPMSAEVDEIIPVSMGGSPFVRSNCQLAHRICNQRRGNKSMKARVIKPLVTSRDW